LFGIFSAGQHVGNVRLHDITSLTAYMGIAIFRAECHGKGIGCAAISAVARYALENLGIKRVLAGVNKQNLASLRAFNRVGFRFLAADDDGEGMLLCLP